MYARVLAYNKYIHFQGGPQQTGLYNRRSIIMVEVEYWFYRGEVFSWPKYLYRRGPEFSKEVFLLFVHFGDRVQ